MSQEIVTRRNLPHWYVPGAAHFVTYRLAGTIPHSVLREMRERRQQRLRQKLPPSMNLKLHCEHIHKQHFQEYDNWLDQHRDIAWLCDPRVAAVVRRNLYFHHGTKYDLLAWCIMPNHVHVVLIPRDVAQAASVQAQTNPAVPTPKLFPPPPDWESDERPDSKSPLSSIMHSLKSYTANECNKLLKREGAFWQRESYDHWVRDENELERIVDYIAANPVRAGLAKRAHEWMYCSAHDRFLYDGEYTAWLGPAVAHAASVQADVGN